MSLYEVNIDGAHKGAHTQVKRILNDILGGTAGWDYDKPVFAFSADDDQAALLEEALDNLAFTEDMASFDLLALDADEPDEIIELED